MAYNLPPGCTLNDVDPPEDDELEVAIAQRDEAVRLLEDMVHLLDEATSDIELCLRSHAEVEITMDDIKTYQRPVRRLVRAFLARVKESQT